MQRYIDNLTGLNNMFYLFEKYENYISNGNTFALSLSINNLNKIINQYGEKITNQYSIMFSNIIKKIFPDSILVSRDIDEFIIITHYSNEIISIKTKQIDQELYKIFEKGLIPDVLTFSCGIKKCSLDINETIFKADLTMFHAKKNSNIFDYYDESLLQEYKNSNENIKQIDKLLCYSNFTHKIQGIYDVDGKKKIINEICTDNVCTDKHFKFFHKGKYLNNYDLKYINQIINDIIPKLNKNEKYIFSVNIDNLSHNQDNFIDYIQDIISKSKINPSQICLNIKILNNIKIDQKIIDSLIRLKKIGLGLCLEGLDIVFNSYIIFIISTVDIDYIKINKAVLIKSINENRFNLMLKNFIKSLIELNTIPIFIDIESKLEKDFIKKIDNRCLVKGPIYSSIEIFNLKKEKVKK